MRIADPQLLTISPNRNGNAVVASGWAINAGGLGAEPPRRSIRLSLKSLRQARANRPAQCEPVHPDSGEPHLALRRLLGLLRRHGAGSLRGERRFAPTRSGRKMRCPDGMARAGALLCIPMTRSSCRRSARPARRGPSGSARRGAREISGCARTAGVRVRWWRTG